MVKVKGKLDNAKCLYFIDLFCGAGGVTSGLHNAMHNNIRVAKVIACINHDANAIKSHYLNHPETVHYTEDIRTVDISGIVEQVRNIRKNEPDAIICIWCSAECTNHSKAKGGKSRNADSRTLYTEIYRYITAIDPDYVFNENVQEIMMDGPLDKNNKPIKELKGTFFEEWISHIKGYGYEYDYRIMNSADYGAATSRTRYFGLFAKPGLPLIFPKQEYAKDPEKSTTIKKKWRPIKETLDFSDEGISIFLRKKKLCKKTNERIYAGLIKHIGGFKSRTEFEKMMASQIFERTKSIKKEYWIDKSYSGSENHQSIDAPSGTIMVNDKHSICKAEYFISRQFSGGGQHQSIDSPAGALLTVPKMELVSVKNNKWAMNMNFNNIGSSIDEPAQTITTNRKHHYIMNPQWFGSGNGSSIEKPCPTIIARQDKAPLYLITAEHAQVQIPVYKDDSEIVIKIKQFMVLYEIIDIKMRMLKILELLKIQGFPDGYKLVGTKTEMKKFIGNSVTPIVPERWVEAIYESILKQAA